MTTVLICDDHRQIREGLRQSVQTVPGVDRVDTAASGEEVLARWPAERQDLVLMDLQMPGLGGLETARRLVRQFPDANVVMLTGAADRDLVALAISGGALWPGPDGVELSLPAASEGNHDDGPDL